MSGTRRSSRRSRGYYGVAVWSPKSEHNVGTLWRSAFLYDAAFICTVGAARYQKQPGDTPHTSNHVPLLHYSGRDDLLAHLPHSCALVGVELDERAVPLPKFAHPERAVYLLGAEDNGIPPSVLAACHHVVKIPGPRDWSMNVAAAGSVVLYDRWAKREAGR